MEVGYATMINVDELDVDGSHDRKNGSSRSLIACATLFPFRCILDSSDSLSIRCEKCDQYDILRSTGIENGLMHTLP